MMVINFAQNSVHQKVYWDEKWNNTNKTQQSGHIYYLPWKKYSSKIFTY